MPRTCAIVGQNAEPDARVELREPGRHSSGRSAYFPERYGEGLIALALDILGAAADAAGEVRPASGDHRPEPRPFLSERRTAGGVRACGGQRMTPRDVA